MGVCLLVYLSVAFFLEVGNPHAHGVIVLFTVIDIPNVIVVVFANGIRIYNFFVFVSVVIACSLYLCRSASRGSSSVRLDTLGFLEHRGFRRTWIAPSPLVFTTRGAGHHLTTTTLGTSPDVTMYSNYLLQRGFFPVRFGPLGLARLWYFAVRLAPRSVAVLGLVFAGLEIFGPLPCRFRSPRLQEHMNCCQGRCRPRP